MNLGFNFDGDYHQVTSKHLPPLAQQQQQQNADVPSDPDDFTREELLKLLSYFEGELQARDEVVARLRNERTKFLLYDAKYGKLGGNDPMCALRRDSTVTEEELDEHQIGQLYESQLVQLEKLIAVQRRSHMRAKNLLAAAEKRHLKALRELELEKERKSRYAAQGDDVLALLEKEREKLTQQLEIQINEVAESKAETERVERKLEAEKERHKSMVLFLINERKQMLVKMHELRIKSEANALMTPGDQALLDELKKEVNFLREERDSLKNANKSLKAENLSLKEVVKGQEADLLMLRKNLISSTKLTFDKPTTHLPQLGDERSLVVANRMATSAGSSGSSSTGAAMSAGTLSSRTRLATSSSFPAEKSRLPRAPSSPARGLPSPRLPSSPSKKAPAMGLGTTRRVPPPPRYAEPELQELEAAIESMAATNVAPTSSPTKRSNSLPRGRGNSGSEVRKNATDQQSSTIYRTEPPSSSSRIPPQPQMGAASRLVPPARQENSYRKPATTVKRNGFSALTKAFGK
ncbi:hypothetical protein Q1695_005843 [Nippostrongylus brasiliensis]|nr:hypothetical protein Q1695_005843 [Nippostrongylus brasiliensis]